MLYYSNELALIILVAFFDYCRSSNSITPLVQHSYVQFQKLTFTGIIFALFSAQPLVIVGTTGALLLFDESLFQLCESSGIEFLTTRVYIGLWLAVIGILVAFFEGSVFVKLFSRFTEDIFSTLIVFLYIIESVMKVCHLYSQHPLLPNYCEFETIVFTNASYLEHQENVTAPEGSMLSVPVKTMVRLPMEDNHGNIINQPNTALFCTILTLTTFAIAYYLRMFRNSQFLGRSVSVCSANVVETLGIFEWTIDRDQRGSGRGKL